MTVARQRLGQAAERHVVDRLGAAGWRVVERNARTRYGELDIVAMDGATLVFIEVKAGRANSAHGPERPILSVGPQKQRRVRRLATALMAERRDLPHYREIRFDAAGVTFDRQNKVVEVEYLRGAF